MLGTGTNLLRVDRRKGQYHAAAYTARVRVSARAGGITIVREGSGTGEGRAPTPGQAHELKGAKTDATKRALSLAVANRLWQESRLAGSASNTQDSANPGGEI